MPRIAIDDLDDPRLEVFRGLKRSNLTRWSGLFIAEGEKLARRLLASRFPIVSMLLGAGEADEFQHLAAAQTPLYVVPDRWVERIVGHNFHRGVLACGRRLGEPTVAELLIPAGSEPVTIVVCPAIHDPENLGVILRTASALGVSGALLGPDSADPFSRRVLRTSMGAVFSLPVRRGDDLAADLARLRDEHGVELAATVIDAQATPLTDFRRPQRLAVLLGNEAHGLRADLLALSTTRLTIPIRATTDSLNVAVAAGIILHAVTATRL